MPRIPRDIILAHLRASVVNRIPIIGSGAGTGLSAKCAVLGGADLVIVYNSGRFRMAGQGSLAGLMPYGDANAIVVDMAKEVIPLVSSLNAGIASSSGPSSSSTIKSPVPVLAGVCGTDPFREMSVFLGQLRDLGFSGVQNFPTVGLIDGEFRGHLEETGISYAKEVEMIRTAHEMGLLTAPYVFDAYQAVQMVNAGADIIVAHMGLTTGGGIGATSGKSLDECIGLIQDIREAAVLAKHDVVVLCHGGPISTVEDAEYILCRTELVHGFFGASSMERLPSEKAIVETTRQFKSIKFE